jgi:hypothetical protein
MGIKFYCDYCGCEIGELKFQVSTYRDTLKTKILTNKE